MKTAWIVLIISALTDFIINAGTGLTAAMVATGTTAIPSNAVLLLALVGGLVSAARTFQQALKSTPETAAALRGDASVVATSTLTKTP